MKGVGESKICGIFGIVDFGRSFGSIELEGLFELGLSTLKHRGPDETIKTAPKDHVLLGMQRLAIQNQARGLYPVESSSRRIVSIYNGEIYNYQSVEKKLQASGCSFTKGSDGACLSEGFDVHGPSFIDLLDGMFAVAFWNDANSTLTLARDHLGIKPLYFFFEKKFLVFSSEPRSILALRQSATFSRSFSFSMNLNTIENLAHFMFAPGNTESFANEIKQVSPGQVLTFSEEGFEEFISSNLNDSGKPRISDLNFALDEVESELIGSIKRHLASDVPIALALSGGIDSSLIAEISKNEFSSPLDAFCISFVNDGRSENSQAQNIAESFCGSFHHIQINPKEIIENFDSYMSIFDNLSTLDGGLISNRIMARSMADKGFKVALFGEGADEIFGGYTWFQLNEGFFRTLPITIKKKIYFYAITRDLGSLRKLEQITSKKMYSNILEFIQDFEVTSQLPQHLLKKIDAATMDASIEGRVPYLDGSLFRLQKRLDGSLISSMPKYGFLPDSSKTKPILRGIYARRISKFGSVPPSKKGFQLPLDTIVTSMLTEIQDLMTSSESISRQILSPRERQMLGNIKGKNLRDSEVWKLWRLLILEKWNRNVWLR